MVWSVLGLFTVGVFRLDAVWFCSCLVGCQKDQKHLACDHIIPRAAKLNASANIASFAPRRGHLPDAMGRVASSESIKVD